jgi:hypothetical protein
MKSPGYSGTPLAKKPGLKKGFKVKLVHEPENYFNLFSDLPEDLIASTASNSKKISFIVHLRSKKIPDQQIRQPKAEMEAMFHKGQESMISSLSGKD